MIFYSSTFVVFFTIFFSLYWFVFNKNLRLQNLLILFGSYVFYGWWDYRFLTLIIAYSLLNYVLGNYIYKATTQKTKTLLKNIGVIAGLGILFYFKYTDFFISSFLSAFEKLNIHLNIHTLKLVMPVGISFYTFRTLSYLFDINRSKVKPAKDWVTFFSFVAFFPCVLSGPIDRARTLIPQLERKRVFSYSASADAMRQILWDLFKKVVIADTLAEITNRIFDNYHNYPGSTLALTAFYFSFQLYADFSGYSDMAIGLARLLGFEVTQNFNYPFFAQNIAQFWRKWHMSLTGWLTEYVFTPLSITFRDYDKWGLAIAIIINFTLIGIWHGANWTLILFGVLHGCYYFPLIIKGTMNKNKKMNPEQLLPSLEELKNIIFTFSLVSFSFILFRSKSVYDAIFFVKIIFSKSLLSYPQGIQLSFFIKILVFVVVEWGRRNQKYALDGLEMRIIKPYRWLIYSTIILLVLAYTVDSSEFMYFKF